MWNKQTCKNLFLRQSCADCLEEYRRSLLPDYGAVWDFVILTASSEAQAEVYRAQIDHRLRCGALPMRTHYAVIPDPDGRRVGSGGATLNVLSYIVRQTGREDFRDLRILTIHSGGDSKRVPQYSVLGKLFSPVPRQLPGDRVSTLFDEIIIGMTAIPARLPDGGMLTLSGDVLLLFNPLQLDFFGEGAAALSVHESAETGKDHGVFRRDADGNVGYFLHKKSVETLRALGATDKNDRVNIDTGAVIFSPAVLAALYRPVRTPEGFARYVNERVRLSFYGDFLYPLASEATLEDFYRQGAEGENTPELAGARRVFFDLLSPYRMKLISFSPASFLHFGTTRELLSLFTEQIDDFAFLDWERHLLTDRAEGDFTAIGSCIAPDVSVGTGSYIEYSDLRPGTRIGKGCVISGVTLAGVTIPDGTVLHGLKLRDGTFTVRRYAVDANPKEPAAAPLWEAALFPADADPCRAAQLALAGVSGPYSLRSSFAAADTAALLPWQEHLRDKVYAARLSEAVQRRIPLSMVKNMPLSPCAESMLQDALPALPFSDSIRTSLYLSRIVGKKEYETAAFRRIREEIEQSTVKESRAFSGAAMVRDAVTVSLPVRVNFGGGWTDTPPYCLEQGGSVLNAAITMDGTLPIEVTLRRLPAGRIVLASTDIGAERTFTDFADLLRCDDPADTFALHKAALLATGLLPPPDGATLTDMTCRIGGGFYLNTRVIRIPKGSGLGTSSILAAACVKALHEFFGVPVTDGEVFDTVLRMEQRMSTGGGWQDQVGGLLPGIKCITSAPGARQILRTEPLRLSASTRAELGRRFALIYTGQRRLARNLLREVVGKYLASDPDTLAALDGIRQMPARMGNALMTGDIDAFAALLNEHWALSRRLDAGCTNTCIDQIFLAVEDMIDGRMICGAGGGGFLYVIMKDGVTREALAERLYDVFGDSGVDVRGCEFYGA